MPRPTIEPVPSERAADLARLAREVFTESYVHDDDPEGFAAYVETAFSDDAVTRELAHHGTHLWWALDDRHPVGFMKADGLQPNEHHAALPALDDAGGLHVQRLYVRKTHQGAGLGRRFLEHAGRIASTDGRSHVWLCVWDQNDAAMGFYRRLGFVELGAHPFVIGSETHRDLALSLALQGVSRD